MEKPKIFATHIFLKKYLDKLGDRYNVVVYPGKDIERADLKERVRGSVAIVSLLTEKIDAEIMEAAGFGLKVISNYAVGYDNVDIEEATKRGICVTNTPGVLTESVAEHVIALILCLYRRVAEGDRLIRAGKFKGWEPDLLLGTSLENKVIGVIGLGRIGRWTVRLAKSVGMKPIYYNRTRNMEFEEEMECSYHSLEKLLSMADVVSLSVPLTEETRGLINYEKMILMKRSSVLINTARGQIVDQDDLIKALKLGVIAGAGIDVFEDESKISKELMDMENVVLTPHVASATIEARKAMATVLVDNLVDAIEGRSPSCLINKEVFSYD